MALPKFSLAAQKIGVAQNLGGLQPPSPPQPVRLCRQRYNKVVIEAATKSGIVDESKANEDVSSQSC